MPEPNFWTALSFFSLMFKRLDLTVSYSGLQLVSARLFLVGKSKEWMKEHKEKVCLYLKLSLSNCTYGDFTASDRLEVKLNSGVPAEYINYYSSRE